VAPARAEVSQYRSLRLLHPLWKPKEIYITENGCAASDVVGAIGNVYDSDRSMYLRNAMMWTTGPRAKEFR
jgi:beta-glucosidase